MKPLTLHRLSIALLTTVLVVCAGVITLQQRYIKQLRADREVILTTAYQNQSAYFEAQTQLKRQKQINAHLERWLNDAAQQPQKPAFTVRNQESRF